MLHFVVDGEDGVFGDVGAWCGAFALVVEDFGAFDVFAFDDGEAQMSAEPILVQLDQVLPGTDAPGNWPD